MCRLTNITVKTYHDVIWSPPRVLICKINKIKYSKLCYGIQAVAQLYTIPNERNPKRTQSRIDTIPNGHNLEWTQSRMDTVSNGHNLEWARSQISTILNGHDLELTNF